MSSEKHVNPKKFLRTATEEDTSKHAGELFSQLCDTQTVRKEIIRARQAKVIPDFELNKVELHITGSCDLKCGFCYGKTVVAEERNVRLEVSDVKSVLQDIRDNMPASEPLVILAGLYGEPLMHPKVVPILDELGEREFRFGFYTNGKRLTEDIMATIIRNAGRNKKGNLPSYISFNVTAMLDEQNTEGESGEDRPRMEQLQRIQRFTELRRQKNSPITVNASLLALPGSVSYPRIVRELNEAKVDNIRLSFPWLPQTDPRKRVLGGLEEDEFEDRTKTFFRLRNEVWR